MGVNVKTIQEEKVSKTCVPFRYVQVLLMFLGFMISFCVRVIMSLAIVAMTDPDSEDTFDWSIKRQSVILSSFNWGYIILQAISGEIAAKFGGRNILLLSMGINSIVSLLLPSMAVYGGWIAVCICRGIQGLSQGAVFPCGHYLISKWVPLNEKSRMTSFVYAGCQFGTASQLIASGFIANYWGWPAIFYINGAFGAVYTIVYWVLGSDSPQVSRMISAEERLHIQTSLGQIGGHKKLKTPWKSILTSLPFISIVIANIGNNWGFWTLLTEIPTYMSKVLGVNIKSNGVVSALPYISMFVMNFPVGYASDYVLKKKWVSVTACRKIANSIGFFGPAITLVCLAYVPAGHVTTAVLLLMLSQALHAGYYSGFILSHLDMAPNFASTLMAISIFVANSVSMFAPLAVGFILEDETNPEEWRLVFFITVILYVISNMVYVIFGTSKLQKWNEPEEERIKV